MERRVPLWRLVTGGVGVAAVVMATLVGTTIGAASAVAADSYPPASLIWDGLLNGQPGITGQFGLFSATPEQLTALHHLEAAAVDDTEADHELSPSEDAAAQTWGRDASEWNLWQQLVHAIETPESARTTDQTNAVEWLQTVVQRERLKEVENAGLEYTKWAGLGASQYRQKLASHPTESELESFLRQAPRNYGAGMSENTPASTSNEGYCVYVSPTEYTQTAYEHNIYKDFWENTAPQNCYTPCSNPISCNVESPSIEEFMQWGVYDAFGPIIGHSSFVRAVGGMAQQADFSAAGSLGVSTVSASGGPPVADSVLEKRIEELVSGYLPDLSPAAGASLDLAEKALGVAEIFITAIAETAGEVLTGFGVVLSVVAVAFEIYKFAVNHAVPGQIAQAITDAADADPPDLADVLNDNPSELFDLFAAATLPAPLSATCDNQIIIDAPCLNAPPVLPSTGNDTQLEITHGSDGTTTHATRVTWLDRATKVTNTAYFVGSWAVNTATPEGSGPTTYQTLDIKYTDWEGAEQTAWIVPSGSAGYQFLTARVAEDGFTPSTCASQGLCKLTSTIEMVSPEGDDFTLRLPFGNGVPAIPAGNCQGGVCFAAELAMSASPGVGEVGKPITVRADWVPPCDGCLTFSPHGTVSFVEDVAGHDTTLCPDVAISAASTSASCTWTAQHAGQIYATYTPAPGPSSTARVQASIFVPVSQAAATRTSLSPAASTVPLGAEVTYTATVRDFYGGDSVVPDGTVTFSEGSNRLCSDVRLTEDSHGFIVAKCSTTFTIAGPRSVLAKYSGGTTTSASAA